MKVKYVGFGGIGIEEPVYEDENGKHNLITDDIKN